MVKKLQKKKQELKHRDLINIFAKRRRLKIATKRTRLEQLMVRLLDETNLISQAPGRESTSLVRKMLNLIVSSGLVVFGGLFVGNFIKHFYFTSVTPADSLTTQLLAKIDWSLLTNLII